MGWLGVNSSRFKWHMYIFSYRFLLANMYQTTVWLLIHRRRMIDDDLLCISIHNIMWPSHVKSSELVLWLCNVFWNKGVVTAQRDAFYFRHQVLTRGIWETVNAPKFLWGFYYLLLHWKVNILFIFTIIIKLAIQTDATQKYIFIGKPKLFKIKPHRTKVLQNTY